jgi:hypothetical protein
MKKILRSGIVFSGVVLLTFHESPRFQKLGETQMRHHKSIIYSCSVKLTQIWPQKSIIYSCRVKLTQIWPQKSIIYSCRIKLT